MTIVMEVAMAMTTRMIVAKAKAMATDNDNGRD